MGDAGALLGGEQILGRGGEESDRLRLLGCLAAADVDHCGYPGQSLVQACGREHVHAATATDGNRVVPVALECGNGQRSDTAGGTDYCNAHVNSPCSSGNYGYLISTIEVTSPNLES